MSEDSTPERTSEAAPRAAVQTGATAVDLTGGVLGLIVFLVGVVLVIATYRQATQWYREIGPAIEAARMGSSETVKQPTTDSPGASAKAAGPVEARPGGKPIAKVGMEFGLRLVWLVLIAFLGFLVAVMGAKLAGAHRGKRT